MSGISISLPLTDAQATACVVAADRFGVEAWEIAVHVLAAKQAMDRARLVAP